VARQELLLLQAMQLHLNQPALFQRFELLRQWRRGLTAAGLTAAAEA
jgi:hypothetical protein